MEDLVFKYLEKISQNKDLIKNPENTFKNIIRNITTGQDLKYDFVSMFTYAIFWQKSTLRIAELIENEFLPKMKMEKNNFQSYSNNLIRYVEFDLIFNVTTTRKVLIGVNEFIIFINPLIDSQLTSPTEFEKALAIHHNKSNTTIKDGLTRFSQMGENTAGLFLKTVGYYSNIMDLEEWKRYRYPML